VVDALAGNVAAVLRPPATVSAAAVASTLVLMDMSSSFLEQRPYPANGAGVLAAVGERGLGQGQERMGW
jgi:hypothetical protein